MEKIYLIDGMSLVFRGYHAMFNSNLKSPTGEQTGAIFAFINMITSLLLTEKPQRIAVVFDRAEPTFRHDMYPEYKATRDKFPEDLVSQLSRIKSFLEIAGIPQLELAGYEADDIIGTLAKKGSKEAYQVFCVTSDKDYIQLIDDYIQMYKPSRRGEGFELVNTKEIAEKYGFAPINFIDYLALWGDSSDNIPGVKGIGEKTALPLIQKYKTIENIYENLSQIEKKSISDKLEVDRENALLSKQLVTIKTDVPIETDLDRLIFVPKQNNDLQSLFTELGFNTLKQKWSKDIAESYQIEGNLFTEETAEEATLDFDTIEDIQKKYVLVNSPKTLDNMLKELQVAKILSVDLETDSLSKATCEIVGIALSHQEGYGYYIPVRSEKELDKNPSASMFETEKDDDDFYFNTEYVLEKLRPILKSPNIEKCGQNIKFDAFILKRFNAEVEPITFDSMVASYLLDPDERHNLDAISRKWLNYEPISIKTLIGEKKSKQISMAELSPDDIYQYACEDADLALKLHNVLKPELEKRGLDKLANEIEFPLIEVLIKMEANGVAIDEETLQVISKETESRAKELEAKIFDEAGSTFNIDSPKQLGHILFEKMGIPSFKKTKTGLSTDVETLTQLAPTYPIAQFILDYRSLVKLKSTYIDALPKMLSPETKLLHTNFNQTIASTGRLSSTEPNLQNIPIRTELGKSIRKAFVPRSKDNLIFSADYSQIELRIIAHISGDENLINAFRENLDIHSATASLLFGKSLDEVNQDMRRIAKTVNFGILYGLGSYGLSQRLNLPRREAQEIIDNYLKKYPGINKYIEETIESTREKGYAETLCGRQRHFNNINSKNRLLRTGDERAAINMPIQGTASDMMKIAMVSVFREMKKLKMQSKMTIQVHDELVFDVIKPELDELKHLVIEKMQGALSLGIVPVKVDTGVGSNWLEAH